MKACFSAGVRLPLALSLLLWAPPVPADVGPLSLDDYCAQLHNLIDQVDGLKDHPEHSAELLAGIPDQVRVDTPAGEIQVKYRDLKNDLARLPNQNAAGQATLLQQLHDYLVQLESGARADDRATELRGLRQDLTHILGRREFHGVHGPSARDILLSKIGNWLERLLERVFRSGKGKFDWVRIVSYPLTGGAVLLLMIWILRRLRRPQEVPVREIVPFSPSARSWRSWLGEARTLAQQQDWRNAIHLAYWAGISFLEEGGLWKPNRARTPREYLLLVGSRKPQHKPLAALTRKFEVVWYGHRLANEGDFQEALGQLEKLGCR